MIKLVMKGGAFDEIEAHVTAVTNKGIAATAKAAAAWLRERGYVVCTKADWLPTAVELLKEAGYVCELPHDWETPSAFCERIHISHATLIRKLRDPRRPYVDLMRARNGEGNLKQIASNSKFEAFCLDHKHTAHLSTAAPVDPTL